MKRLTKKYLDTEFQKDLELGLVTESDRENYKDIVKKRLEDEEEKERFVDLWNRDIKYSQDTIQTVGNAPNDRKVFSVGEDVVVSHGGFISAEIVEVLSEGVYNVHITYKTTKAYSTEKYITDKNMVLGWWQIWKNVEEKALNTLGKELFIQFMQQSVSSLIHKYFNHRGVDMDPPYQRGFVWTDKQKEELLDSIFNYIDIGKFVFVRLPYTEGGYSYQILDGKQKLKTLIDFYTDQFKYKGFYYSELPWEMKNVFYNKSVSVGEVSDRTYDEGLIKEYFIKLNTAGIPMSKEHLNKIKDV